MLNIDHSSFGYILSICLISFLLLGLFSILYWTLPDGQTIKLTNYTQIITIFIVMITGLITVINFKNQLDDRKRAIGLQYTSVTQSETNDIDKLFMSNPLLNRLYFEMYSNNPQINKIKQMYQDQIQETPEMLKMEHHMASIIFQKIADIYFCEQLDNNSIDVEDSVEWINTFHEWLKSPILLSHWKYLRYEQHPNARHFIDQLIKSANNPPR